METFAQRQYENETGTDFGGTKITVLSKVLFIWIAHACSAKNQ
jgi:hypothetical protein